MPNWFQPNIQGKGRIVRGVMGVVLLGAGVLLLETAFWLALVLFAAGGFAIFEALRGWCAARACGIKTRF
jgi:hypothetical protein